MKSASKHSSGKVLTIFIVIVAFLLVSLTAISIFFFQKELERRKMTEAILEKSRTDIVKIEEELKEANKQKFLLEEKFKEADERINDVSDELELEKGLREEAKQENLALKQELEKLRSEKDSLLAEKTSLQQSLIAKISDLETKLQAAHENRQTQEQATSSSVQVESSVDNTAAKPAVSDQIINATTKGNPVSLDKIVVAPDEIPEGRILSIDTDTEFVILNLGAKDGVEIGNVLSVFRGKDYLGDIKITRVQPDMSAADLIPPFSSRVVRKNDQVILK